MILAELLNRSNAVLVKIELEIAQELRVQRALSLVEAHASAARATGIALFELGRFASMAFERNVIGSWH